MSHRLAVLSISLILATPALAAGKGTDAAVLQRIDALFEHGMRENYHTEGLALMQESLEACTAALAEDPESYDLLWRCARAAVERAETSRIIQDRDWKADFRSNGARAVEWAGAAKCAAPGRVEGYYWQLQAMGLIYDAEGTLSFLGKGYAPRSKENLDACYRIDRSYLDCTPVLALALYYSALPAVLGQDIDRALALYDEFAAATSWGFEPYRQLPCAAALLQKAKRRDRTDQARELLLMALSDPTPRPAYADMARKLLARITPGR